MSYQRILLATDLSEDALRAARLAKTLGSDRTRYRVLHVLPTPPSHEYFPTGTDGLTERRRREAALPILQAWCEAARLPQGEPTIRIGSIGTQVIHEANDFVANLVVAGARGATRSTHTLLGPTARRILRTSPVDALVVRAREDEPSIRSILLATDFQPPSQHAAERAARLAKEHDASLHLVHAFDADIWKDTVAPLLHDERPTDEWLRSAYERMLRTYNEDHLQGKARTALVVGRPALAVGAHAREIGADLLVLGTHGGGEIEHPTLGSSAESIAEHAPCSVLIAR